MLGTLKTLFAGANARAEEHLKDSYAIELIDQNIREASAALKAAKLSLANLIQRQHSENLQAESLVAKIADMTERAREALQAERQDLAQTAAAAIAEMENELVLRQQTLERLDRRILQLRGSVERAHRRIIDLKQGAIAARATRREQAVQKRLNTHAGGTNAIEEAEELIARVMNADDPFEQSEILRGIEEELSHDGLADRMADAGFGPRTRSTATDVLNRLNA
ncbi:MAG: PspA/IM30 family protein [Rhodobacteraceae bacterium]|nr:PspA/IM30 family protein [Paracoccaceae bacterium]